jgi:energy-coupling factor transporter ATP-binding protein EcfA2
MVIRRKEVSEPCSLSRQEKIAQFSAYTVVHPHLRLAYEDFLDAIRNPGGASLVFLFGPTGVGKTTLLRQIVKVLIEKYSREIETNSDYFPVATVEAVAPESGNFDWKNYYQSILVSLTEFPHYNRFVKKRSRLNGIGEHQRLLTSANNLSRIREQVIVSIRQRRLVALLTDEAQRFTKMSSGRRQRDQMDAMQSMVSMTRRTISDDGICTLHGLFGTYELLDFRNLSAQLSRRSIDIHFPRYQVNCSQDLFEFKRVLKSFAENMIFQKTPELEKHWDYFYERSIGCVGILKDWLTQAYRKALDEDASTLTIQHWQPYAPSVAKCLSMAAEAVEGEKAFQEKEGELALLRQQLGLSRLSHSVKGSENLSAKPTAGKKRKGRPGVRAPHRDVIGEAATETT